MTSENTTESNHARLLSLDALRGLDMFLLVGLGPIFKAIAGASDRPVARFITAQTKHPDWHGFTLWDLIFPLFIFIVGVALSFSLGKRRERDGKASVYRHIFIRAIVLTLLGLVFWGTPGGFHPDRANYSVLYRIAVSYFFASLIMIHCRPRIQASWAFGILTRDALHPRTRIQCRGLTANC